MNKIAVHHITKVLGRDAICDQLEVSYHSVRNARTTGSFPALWYDAIYEMCSEAGIPCPRNAFNFRPRVKNIGNNRAQNKGNVANKAKKVGSSAKSGGAAFLKGERNG